MCEALFLFTTRRKRMNKSDCIECEESIMYDSESNHKYAGQVHCGLSMLDKDVEFIECPKKKGNDDEEYTSEEELCDCDV